MYEYRVEQLPVASSLTWRRRVVTVCVTAGTDNTARAASVPSSLAWRMRSSACVTAGTDNAARLAAGSLLTQLAWVEQDSLH